MSMSRQLRRAAERQAAKQARKDAKLGGTQFESQNVQPIDHEMPSRRSGGPRTAEGKAKSSLNHLQHGLTGSFRILEFESQSDYDALLTAFTEEHQPQTATETILVEKMAQHAFLSRRAQRLQDDALINDDLKRLSLFLRYQTSNDRGFFKCLTELRKLQKEREKAQIQFVSQSAVEARTRLNNAKAHHLEVDAAIRHNLQISSDDLPPILFSKADYFETAAS